MIISEIRTRGDLLTFVEFQRKNMQMFQMFVKQLHRSPCKKVQMFLVLFFMFRFLNGHFLVPIWTRHKENYPKLRKF
jgi:hypothetical protein